MKDYFVIEESPGKGFYLVWNHTARPYSIDGGSFGVLPARLLGITFASYLRLCRDEFNATIYGKNSLYPVPIYSTFEEANRIKNFITSCIE